MIRANGLNIVGQQLPTLLLDVNVLRPFAHTLLHVFAESFKQVKL